MSVPATPTPLTKKQAYALVDAVMDKEGLALAASAHELASGEWVFEATCTQKPDLDLFAEISSKVLGGTLGLSTEPLPKTDWVEHSLKNLAPVVAGGFFIHGSHDVRPPAPAMVSVQINAGQAFGTGHHESTSGCLRALDRAIRHQVPKTIIDIGTGSGILAIAAAKRLGRQVLATDNDPKAVLVADENARSNGVDHLVETLLASSLDDTRIAASAPFDLIMANILAGPVIEMAPQIAKMAAPRATIIVSGLLERQVLRVTSAYLESGMVLRHQANLNGWSTLMFEVSV
ncbi:MAG: 50S ribosomal protein L11 methyltransferase [Alphaproteobacteria bacterium]|nr:50S ribosomal protein L11 methyltransferase [Alphaproteobacteria bacterium]